MESFGFSNIPDEPDILSGYFNGLFPDISTENSIINCYTETHLPSEPVLQDTITHTFYIPRKPTNTWTLLSQLSINCGFKFEKKVVDIQTNKITWEGVKPKDNAVPVSNLIQSCWSDVDIRLNQQRVTNNRHNSQVTSILSKLTNSHYYSATLGRLSGVADDSTDPDITSNENTGVKLRQNMFCIPDDDTENKANLIHLTGPLYSSISSNPWPIPSEIDIYISMTRNKDEVLVSYTGDQDTIFRITLEYLEVLVPRIIIDPSIHNKIELHLNKKSIKMVYNRLEIRSFVIGPGRLSFDSGSLFQGYDIVSKLIYYN